MNLTTITQLLLNHNNNYIIINNFTTILCLDDGKLKNFDCTKCELTSINELSIHNNSLKNMPI